MRNTLEHTSNPIARNSEIDPHELLRHTTLPATKEILTAQLLGEEEYRYLTDTSPRLMTGDANPQSPYFTFETPIDFSNEAIEANAFRLAAETLPREIVEKIQISHDIPDNVGFHHPPSLDSIMLTIQAWERTGYNVEVKRAIEAMLDFVNDRAIRDNIAEALRNAEATQESFVQHFQLVDSRQTNQELDHERKSGEKLSRIALSWSGDLSYDAYYKDPAQPLSEEYHERLVDFDTDSVTAQPNKMIFYPEEASLRGVYKYIGKTQAQLARRLHKDAITQRKIQQSNYTAAELATLRRKDVAKKVDMSQFFDD